MAEGPTSTGGTSGAWRRGNELGAASCRVSGIYQNIEFATTRYWTYNNVAKIDATPEVLAEARRYLIDLKVKAARAAAEARAREIRPGREVRVVKGRKLPVGTTGRCIAVRDGAYGKYAVVLLPEERRTVNVNIGNLEVVNPQIEFDEAFVRAHLERAEGEWPNFRLY